MRRTIIQLIAFIFFVSGMGQSPLRKVIYTFDINEELYAHEYLSNMKIAGNKFACVVRNKVNSKLSFILNGATLVTAKKLEIHWVDPYSRNNCIYSYADNNSQEYIVIDGNKYGPFEEIAYIQHANMNNWDGTPNLDLRYNKNTFKFKRMGKVYRHDNDGSIYECDGDNPWGATERSNPTYHSRDGLHKAQFSMNYHLLTVDGIPYVLPVDVDARNINVGEIAVTDYGTVVASMNYHDGTEWVYKSFVIGNNSLELIKSNEYFEPETGTIVRKSDNQTPSRPQLSGFDEWRDENGNWIYKINYSLQDKTNRHFFTANWAYKYVMIDDKKFGHTTPFYAFYDDTNDAFGWVSVEGRQLVLYTYRLSK